MILHKNISDYIFEYGSLIDDIVVVHDDGADIEILHVDNDHFMELPRYDVGQPVYYTSRARVLQFYPIPDRDYNVEVTVIF